MNAEQTADHTTAAGAEPTPLERQQIQITEPGQETFWHRVRFELTARLAARAGATALLDFGAGAGLLGDWVLAHRPDVDYRFEELSPVLDAALTTRFGAERRSTPDQPIARGTAVAMLDVVEHIEDDLGALRAVHRRMAPGDVLIITVPALPRAYSSWDEQLGHFRRYTRRSLRRLVAGAGFHVESAAYLFPELLPLLPLRKLRRSARSDADFPQLGRLLSAVGYAISTTTTALRRVWPAGTSVVLTATKPS